MNVINQNGTAYVDNKEYTTLNGNNVLTALNRVHNTEGYVYNLLKQYGAMYCYNRKDHLGNIREVWRAAGYISSGTEQYTQYYPSGVPWASNTGDNPGTQPYKYYIRSLLKCMGMIRMITGQEGIMRLWGDLRVSIHWRRNITRLARMHIVIIIPLIT